jgi:hypothetical protein
LLASRHAVVPPPVGEREREIKGYYSWDKKEIRGHNVKRRKEEERKK